MLFHVSLLNLGNARFQSPENLLSLAVRYLCVDHGILDVGVSEVVFDELYSFTGIKQMGGYGVPETMDRIFWVDPCFLRISLEKLMRSLPADVTLSASEQGIAGIQPLFEILPDELFGSLEERSFPADPAFQSMDEYLFVFKVDVGEFEREGF